MEDIEHTGKYHKTLHIPLLHARSYSRSITDADEIVNFDDQPPTSSQIHSQHIELKIPDEPFKSINENHDEEQKYVETQLMVKPPESTNRPLIIYVDDIKCMDIINNDNQRSSVIRYKIAESSPLSKYEECKIRMKYISRKQLHNLFLIILAMILLTITVTATIGFINEFQSLQNNKPEKTKLFEIKKNFNLSHEEINNISSCNIRLSSIFAWYDAMSYDHKTNILFDKSVHKNDIKTDDITGSVRLGIDDSNQYYLFGFLNDTINFESTYAANYTVIYVLYSSELHIFKNDALSWDSIVSGNENKSYWQIRAIMAIDNVVPIEECLINYLKQRYINVEDKPVVNVNDITISECNHWQSSQIYKDDMIAWYDANQGIDGNTLVDLSGNGNHIYVEDLKTGVDPEGNFKYIYGSTQDFIQLHKFEMEDHSIIQVTYVGKLIGNARDKLLCDDDNGLTIGFYRGYAANCRIIRPDAGIVISYDFSGAFQDEWLLSTYQDFRKNIQSARTYYAQNGKRYASNIDIRYETHNVNLGVNCNQSSDWAITEIIIFKTKITSSSFKSWKDTYCIEKYLSNKYSIDIWEYEYMSLIITMPSINLFVITLMTAFIPIIIFCCFLRIPLFSGYGTCCGTVICCISSECFIQCCCCNFRSLCEKYVCCKCCNNCCPSCEASCCCDCCCLCRPYCYNTCCSLKGAMCRHYAMINIMGFPCLALVFTIVHCFRCTTDLFSINKSSILSSFTCFMIVLIQFFIDIIYIMDQHYDELIVLSYNLMWMFCIFLQYIMLFELLHYKHPYPDFKNKKYSFSILLVTIFNFAIILLCLSMHDLNSNNRLLIVLLCSFILATFLLVSSLWYAWNMKELLVNIAGPSVIILTLVISILPTISFNYNETDFYFHIFLNLLPTILIAFYAAIWNPDTDCTLPSQYNQVHNSSKRLLFASMNTFYQPSYYFQSLKYYIPPSPLNDIDTFKMILQNASKNDLYSKPESHHISNTKVSHLKLEWLLNRNLRIDSRLLGIIECEAEVFQLSALNKWNLTINDCVAIAIFVYFAQFRYSLQYDYHHGRNNQFSHWIDTLKGMKNDDTTIQMQNVVGYCSVNEQLYLRHQGPILMALKSKYAKVLAGNSKLIKVKAWNAQSLSVGWLCDSPDCYIVFSAKIKCLEFDVEAFIDAFQMFMKEIDRESQKQTFINQYLLEQITKDIVLQIIDLINPTLQQINFLNMSEIIESTKLQPDALLNLIINASEFEFDESTNAEFWSLLFTNATGVSSILYTVKLREICKTHFDEDLALNILVTKREHIKQIAININDYYANNNVWNYIEDTLRLILVKYLLHDETSNLDITIAPLVTYHSYSHTDDPMSMFMDVISKYDEIIMTGCDIDQFKRLYNDIAKTIGISKMLDILFSFAESENNDEKHEKLMKVSKCKLSTECPIYRKCSKPRDGENVRKHIYNNQIGSVTQVNYDKLTKDEIATMNMLDLIHIKLFHDKNTLYRTNSKDEIDQTTVNRFCSNITAQDKKEEKQEKKENIELDFGVHITNWYVKPKFKNYQEEWLQNTYAPLPPKTLQTIKAECKILAGLQWNKWKLREDELLILKIYCDTNNLQGEFRKAFRSSGTNVRRSQFVHWAINLEILFSKINSMQNKLIKQVLWRKSKLYHGLDKMFTTNSLSRQFYGLMSTTIDPSVAANFAGGTGMILVMNNKNLLNNNNDKNILILYGLDVSWISSYSEEREVLLMNPTVVIQNCIVFSDDTDKQSSYLCDILLSFDKDKNAMVTLASFLQSTWIENVLENAIKNKLIQHKLFQQQQALNNMTLFDYIFFVAKQYQIINYIEMDNFEYIVGHESLTYSKGNWIEGVNYDNKLFVEFPPKTCQITMKYIFENESAASMEKTIDGKDANNILLHRILLLQYIDETIKSKLFYNDMTIEVEYDVLYRFHKDNEKRIFNARSKQSSTLQKGLLNLSLKSKLPVCFSEPVRVNWMRIGQDTIVTCNQYKLEAKSNQESGGILELVIDKELIIKSGGGINVNGKGRMGSIYKKKKNKIKTFINHKCCGKNGLFFGGGGGYLSRGQNGSYVYIDVRRKDGIIHDDGAGGLCYRSALVYDIGSGEGIGFNGGCSHLIGSKGGNGGGQIIIKCNDIIIENFDTTEISCNGANGVNYGGGGSGGSVYIKTNITISDYLRNIRMSVEGGKGGGNEDMDSKGRKNKLNLQYKGSGGDGSDGVTNRGIPIKGADQCPKWEYVSVVNNKLDDYDD